MLRRGDDYELVAMNEYNREPSVGYRERNYAEVNGVADSGFKNFCVIGALDIHAHVWILLFEFGENLRQDVQAGAFVGSDDNLSAGHALGFGDGGQHGLARSDDLFGKFLEELARGRD